MLKQVTKISITLDNLSGRISSQSLHSASKITAELIVAESSILTVI